MQDSEFPEKIQKMISHLSIEKSAFIGMEGYVFSYTRDTVIKIYIDMRETYLQSLKQLHDLLGKYNFTFRYRILEKLDL